MEFKILRSWFRSLYELPYDFDFPGYMGECLDHHILEIVEVEGSTWAVLILLALAVLGASKAVGSHNDGDDSSSSYGDDSSYSYYASSSHHGGDNYSDTSSSHHRGLGTASAAAGGAATGVYSYAACGWLLLLWTLAFYCLSLRSERALMRRAGCWTAADYAPALERATKEEQEHNLRLQKQREEERKLQKEKAEHEKERHQADVLHQQEIQTLAQLKLSAEQLINSVKHEKIKQKAQRQQRHHRRKTGGSLRSSMVQAQMSDASGLVSQTLVGSTFNTLRGINQSMRLLIDKTPATMNAGSKYNTPKARGTDDHGQKRGSGRGSGRRSVCATSSRSERSRSSSNVKMNLKQLYLARMINSNTNNCTQSTNIEEPAREVPLSSKNQCLDFQAERKNTEEASPKVSASLSSKNFIREQSNESNLQSKTPTSILKHRSSKIIAGDRPKNVHSMAVTPKALEIASRTRSPTDASLADSEAGSARPLLGDQKEGFPCALEPLSPLGRPPGGGEEGGSGGADSGAPGVVRASAAAAAQHSRPSPCAEGQPVVQSLSSASDSTAPEAMITAADAGNPTKALMIAKKGTKARPLTAIGERPPLIEKADLPWKSSSGSEAMEQLANQPPLKGRSGKRVLQQKKSRGDSNNTLLSKTAPTSGESSDCGFPEQFHSGTSITESVPALGMRNQLTEAKLSLSELAEEMRTDLDGFDASAKQGMVFDQSKQLKMSSKSKSIDGSVVFCSSSSSSEDEDSSSTESDSDAASNDGKKHEPGAGRVGHQDAKKMTAEKDPNHDDFELQKLRETHNEHQHHNNRHDHHRHHHRHHHHHRRGSSIDLKALEALEQGLAALDHQFHEEEILRERAAQGAGQRPDSASAVVPAAAAAGAAEGKKAPVEEEPPGGGRPSSRLAGMQAAVKLVVPDAVVPFEQQSPGSPKHAHSDAVYRNRKMSRMIFDHPETAIDGAHAMMPRLLTPLTSRKNIPLLPKQHKRHSLSVSRSSSGNDRNSGSQVHVKQIDETAGRCSSASSKQHYAEFTNSMRQRGTHMHEKHFEAGKFSADLGDVYPFGSPHLFHKTLEILLLFNCLYLALYASNFLMVALEMEHASVLAIFLLLPELFMLPLLGLTIRTASLLEAIAEMKPDIITKVIEHTLDVRKLADEIRTTILEEIETRSLGRSGLTTIFSEMDLDFDGEITYDEFKVALHTLDLHISYERLLRLFRHVDRGRSGTITFSEFAKLVDPEEAARQDAVALTLKVVAASPAGRGLRRRLSNAAGTVRNVPGQVGRRLSKISSTRIVTARKRSRSHSHRREASYSMARHSGGGREASVSRRREMSVSRRREASVSRRWETSVSRQRETSAKRGMNPSSGASAGFSFFQRRPSVTMMSIEDCDDGSNHVPSYRENPSTFHGIAEEAGRRGGLEEKGGAWKV